MTTTLINYNIPDEMRQYLSYYGLHFNKKLCEFATERMEKKDKTTGESKKVTPVTMYELKEILSKNNIEIDPNCIYDALYLANMVKADFWNSSIEDEVHMAKYIEDVICDTDGYDGIVFNRYLADCEAKGVVVFWDMML